MTDVKQISKNKMIKCQYAVTFEFMVRPPITVHGEVEASSVHTLALRAMKSAKRITRTSGHISQHGTTIGWSSISILLDRYNARKKNNTNQEV